MMFWITVISLGMFAAHLLGFLFDYAVRYFAMKRLVSIRRKQEEELDKLLEKAYTLSGATESTGTVVPVKLSGTTLDKNKMN